MISRSPQELMIKQKTNKVKITEVILVMHIWRSLVEKSLKIMSFSNNLCHNLEMVMNELRRFKHSADFLAISSHVIESAAISAS